LQGNGQNDQPRQRQETVPGRERIVEIVDVQAVRSGVAKAYFRVLFWVGGVLVDKVGMIMVVAMIVRVRVGMIMRGRMVRMRSRRLMG
jgi:hypothetical protein